MIRELHLCHALLVAAFAVQTADLDAPQHSRRVAATKELHRCYPWSLPACVRVVEQSESPEAVQRAEQVLQRSSSILNALRWDRIVWRLIATKSEHDGLPWLSWERYGELYDSPDAKDAFARRIGIMRDRGHFRDERFWCESDVECCSGYLPAEGVMQGINQVRFVARGLPWPYQTADRKPVPLWVVKRAWAMLKANGRGQPR